MKSMILIGGAAAAFLLYKLFHSVKSLQYVVKGVKVSFDGAIPVFAVNAEIINNSGVSYDVSAFAGSLYFSGVFVGAVGGVRAFEIPANSRTNFEFSVRLPLASIVSDVLAKITQKNGLNYKINFDGYIVSKGVSIPVNLAWVI